MNEQHHSKGNTGMLAILGLALLVIVGGYFYFKGKAGPAPAEETGQSAAQTVSSTVKRIALVLNEQNDSGETGSALLSDESGKTRVALMVSSATSTPLQPAHIHTGSCKELGSIAYPLTSVASGASETVLDVSIDALLNRLPLAINIHKSPEEANVYVSCTELQAPVAMDTDTAAVMAQQSPSRDEKVKKLSKAALAAALKGVTFDYVGVLADVTDGTTLLGVTTDGLGSGSVRATFAKGVYQNEATFKNLPDPSGTDFYEGWIVRKAVNGSNDELLPFDFISTGRAVKAGGTYMNRYVSGADLTDHFFYVLTLESDDGNSAPSGHVLEGTLLGSKQETEATATTTPER